MSPAACVNLISQGEPPVKYPLQFAVLPLHFFFFSPVCFNLVERLNRWNLAGAFAKQTIWGRRKDNISNQTIALPSLVAVTFDLVAATQTQPQEEKARFEILMNK